ncbi:MAG: Cobalt-zinc-cadmium resistance protein CzcA [Candidatus Aminicenantes bacterium ADurb.Bin147]|jgi:heavy metal efflux pump (cobalt-zinc-cadmium)|nr:CusA/CzcA family heavy metal efflux RND transporter [Acidobacteriota bacterium]OQB57458.1 MAG: Cobalt-zinc-cadmium resistance protein CzcA [Candidatus Aminicenantes bacterium ADurb.Bin147]HPN15823.1 CusA/CzcA family heavy metal efflux RND transporter [Candidatus Aminicenantes bacterium]HQF96872.1 CusA/CzcA family heavy metal efflux RND transporter [Candidatus Aminicenantes bacterium]
MDTIERLISRSLRNRLLVLIGVALLVGFGIWSFLKIPLDAFPDVTNIQVEVLSSAPGLSPLEVEKFVTFPVETTLQGLPRLTQLRSVSKFGLSVITVVFEDGVDIYFARQLVLERLIEARERVPQGIEITMGPVSTAMGEIYQYTLEGPVPEGEDEEARAERLTELRTVQDWILAPLLKSVPGVSEINSFGGHIRQYEVTVDPDRLLKYGLTVADAAAALERNNLNVGGSVLEDAAGQALVRGVGLLRSASDMERIVLKSEAGTPVFLGDVAAAGKSRAVRQGAAVKDGKGEAVGGVVMMLRGANGREVVRAVEARVAEVNAGAVLPSGLQIVPFYKRSDIVQASLHTVSEALIIGGIFVLLVLYLFLRSFRGAFIVILALPLSVLFTFIAMRLGGLSANLMSLGGLAISIGMIIDATIIQVENVQRHLSESGPGRTKTETVLSAVLEVRKPSIFGELIIALTFIPIFALQGIEGKMFAPLAFTHVIALCASLCLSLLVIPAFCRLLLKPQGEKRIFLVEAARKAYLPLLRWSLDHKKTVFAVSLGLLAASAVLIPRLGTEFMPIMDEGAFDMDVQFAPGISLPQSLAMNRKVEEKLISFPEIETVVGKTGQTGIALEARGVEKTGYVGILKPRRQWTSARSRGELTEKMREAVSTIPGMAFSFSQPIACRIDELVAGTRAQLIIKLFGEDLDTLTAKAGEIAAALRRLRGASDLVVESVAGQPYLSVLPDRERIARYGLSVEDVQTLVETAVGGRTVTRIYEGERAVDVQLRYAEKRRGSAEAIGALPLRTERGEIVPLSQAAAIVRSEGPSQISREAGRRRIGIECNISGRDLGGFVAEARREVARSVSLPAGYFLSWGGQFENQQRAMRRLGVILPVTVGLILLLLFLTFNALRPALLVLFNLPFALIGGVLSLYLSGLYLSVPASVGFIALFGIAVLNGIVLLSAVAQRREEGLAAREAILQGCLNRLRPVLMTATITICSLLPLLFAQGPGSEIQRPLAVVVVGGLATSTLMTLLVLPALEAAFGEDRMRRGGRGRRPCPEPADGL